MSSAPVVVPSARDEPFPDAFDQIDRRLGVIPGVSGVAMLLMYWVSGELGSMSSAEPWWLLGDVAFILLLLVGAAGVRWLPRAALRATWMLVPCVHLLLVLMWPATVASDAQPMPWSWGMEPVAVGYATLAWGARIGAVYAFGAAAALQGAFWCWSGSIPDEVMTAGFIHFGNVAFVAIIAVMRRQLRLLRRSERAAWGQTVRSTRAEAARLEQERLATVVHDEVLAALIAAAQTPGSLAPMTIDQGERALAVLARDLQPSVADGDTDPAVLATSIERRASELAVGIEVRVDAAPGASAIPNIALESILAATDEALRNSVRHAGPGTRRWVRIHLGTDVTVEVEDDGTGFDPDVPTSARLGISRSIVARMAAVPGGSARVTSAPARGTRVTIRWRPMGDTGVRPASVEVTAPFLRRHSVSGIRSRMARVAVLLVWVTGVIQTAWVSHRFAEPSLVAVALVLTLVAAYLLSDPRGGDPLRRGSAWLISAFLVINTLLVLWQIDPEHARTMAWTLQVGAYWCALLCLVGRWREGGVGVAALTALVVTWVVARGAPGSAGFAILAYPILAYALGIAWRALLERNIRTVSAHRSAERRAAITETAARDAIIRSQATLRVIDAMARGPLERITAGGTLEDGDRSRIRLAEASVRDRIRARKLAIDPLAGASTAARARGVEVLLLDDDDDVLDSVPATELSRLAALIADVPAGRVVIRVAPRGGPVGGTMVVDDGGSVVRHVFRTTAPGIAGA